MFRDSVRASAEPWFSQVKDRSPECGIVRFYDDIGFKSMPPVDFPNVQQFLIAMLEDSLTRLVDLHVENVDDQRTLTFHKAPEMIQQADKGALFLALYLQLHFDFSNVPPVALAPKVRGYIRDSVHDCSLRPLSRANNWI
jgi:hypothetical protein